MLFKATLLFCIAFVGLSSVQAQEALRVLPMPSEIQPGEGFLSVDGSFRISLGGYRDAVIQNAAIRLASNLSVKTGLKLALQPVPEGKAATLRVHCDARRPAFPYSRSGRILYARNHAARGETVCPRPHGGFTGHGELLPTCADRWGRIPRPSRENQ